MRTKSEPQTPPRVADLSEAEINQRVLAKARQMSPAEILALSIRCGIHRPDGGLTPEYGGEPSPHRGGADNGESVAE